MICNPQKVQSNSLFDFHSLQKFAEWLYQYHRHREKTFAYLIILKTEHVSDAKDYFRPKQPRLFNLF